MVPDHHCPPMIGYPTNRLLMVIDDPVEARLAAAATFLRLRDFSPMQALELRLEAARAGDPS